MNEDKEIILDNLSDNELEVIGEYHRRLRCGETKLHKAVQGLDFKRIEIEHQIKEFNEKNTSNLAKSSLICCAKYMALSSAFLGLGYYIYDDGAYQTASYIMTGVTGLLAILEGKTGLKQLASLSERPPARKTVQLDIKRYDS